MEPLIPLSVTFAAFLFATKSILLLARFMVVTSTHMSRFSESMTPPFDGLLFAPLLIFLAKKASLRRAVSEKAKSARVKIRLDYALIVELDK